MSTISNVTRMTLSNVMEFDRVIRVLPGGNVTDVRGPVIPPELTDGDLSCAQGDDWELMNGYSGQYGYSGPEMHPSEYIGGRMAQDILDNPGLYVSVIAYATCDECEGEPEDDAPECESCNGAGLTDEAWAVARILD